MCDTMVALGNSTRDGTVLLAKNSDRQPNEPHIMIRVPRRSHSPGEKLHCTYIEVEQVETTFEVLLLKPSWIWGCEMGANQYGVNIGNEAVFTREPYGNTGLTGMDMVRLALERCKTAEEALECIIELIFRYGQGGNCGYEKSFTYHNSFLIADLDSAWVLETAGKYWATQKVTDVRSISNCLSIGSEFDRYHPEIIKHAVEKGWCRYPRDFNFAKCYSDPLVTYFSGARERLETCQQILEQEKGYITTQTMKKILRTHESKLEGQPFTRSSLKSVCMHAGFVFGDHTTGSYVADLSRDKCTYWVTGSSTPCISIFKPLWLVDGENLTFKEEKQNAAVEYWRQRERIHRLFLSQQITDVSGYLAQRDALEEEFEQIVAALDFNAADCEDLAALVEQARVKEQDLIDKNLAQASDRGRIKGGLYFKHFWKKQNQSLMELWEKSPR